MILPFFPALVLGFCMQGPASDWFTVTAGGPEVSATALEQVRADAGRAIEVLQKDFPALPTRRFRIILHDRREAMPAALQAMHHEGSPGFTLLARHEVHLVHRDVAGSGRGFWPVVLHELTHEFLEQHSMSRGGVLPRWFHEGMAQTIAKDTYLGATEDSLVYRIASRRMFGFRQIAKSFPPEPNERQAAYAQSYSFVAWIEREYGRELLVRCAGMVDRETTIERALVLTTERSTEELQQGWRDYLVYGSGATWRIVLEQCFSLSIIFALPLLALAVVRSIRRDQRARRMIQQTSWDPERIDFVGPPLPPDWVMRRQTGRSRGMHPGVAGGAAPQQGTGPADARSADGFPRGDSPSPGSGQQHGAPRDGADPDGRRQDGIW